MSASNLEESHYAFSHQLNFCVFLPIHKFIQNPQIYRDLQEMQKDVDEMKKAREKKERTPKSDEKKKAFSLRRSSP